MKKSFKLFIDSLDVLDDLSDEQAGQLFKAIRKYEANGEEVLSGLMKAIFTPFKNNSDRATLAYNAICEANKANGLKGGRPKREDNPIGLNETEQKPKNPDKDKDKDKDKRSKGCRLENLPIEQKNELYTFMKNHCLEAGVSLIEIDKFSDYWKALAGAKGIKLDWEATFRNWCRSNFVTKQSEQRMDISKLPEGVSLQDMLNEAGEQWEREQEQKQIGGGR